MKIKQNILRIYLLFFCVQLFTFCLTAKENRPGNETFGSIQLPPVQSIILDNGLTLHYIKDELPRLTIVVTLGFGTLYENENNAGISELLSSALSFSGSKKYPDQVLHDKIESIGGRLSISSSWENTTIVIQVLQRYSDMAFDILSDLLLNPNFEPAQLEKARSLLLEKIRRKGDDPENLAFEKIREIIFSGAGYGAIPSENSIKSINMNDINRAYDKYFKGENIIVGIAGSMEIDEVKKNLTGLKKINRGLKFDYSVDEKKIGKTAAENPGKIYLIPKDIPQATLVLGAALPSIRDPAIFPIIIMNNILGGGSFSSRLMREIRVKRGLSYSVQSIARFRKNTGVFLAFAQTKTETADQTMSLLLENIALISQETVSDDELTLAKESIVNSYIFEFESPLNILDKYSFLSYNGLLESFLTEYIRDINKVSKENVLKSAGENFHIGLVKVVVGKIELKEKLKKFGEVLVIE